MEINNQQVNWNAATTTRVSGNGTDDKWLARVMIGDLLSRHAM